MRLFLVFMFSVLVVESAWSTPCIDRCEAVAQKRAVACNGDEWCFREVRCDMIRCINGCNWDWGGLPADCNIAEMKEPQFLKAPKLEKKVCSSQLSKY